MAYDILTTSGIISFVNSYISNETHKLITPITNRTTKYQNLSSAYSTLSSKLGNLKKLLNEFKSTEVGSLFNSKLASSSNSNFVNVTATGSASVGAFSLRVGQLAKNDLLVSQEFASAGANAITGTHNFLIKTGDGEGGEFVSNIAVDFSDTETNQTVMEKIRDAVNSDKAVVNSGTKSASADYTGGTSTFKINLNGTETSITVNGGGTYEDLIDELASKINTDISGVTAEKIIDSPNPGDVNIKLTVNDSSKYISISHESGFDTVSDLNIAVTKEKGASGIITASAFSPVAGYSQFTLTSKETGSGFSIKELSDGGLSSALSGIGLNLGVSRPSFEQSTNPDTPGYVYADISENSLLNSRITFNGLTVQRNSNTISDLVSGVTFDLKSVMQESDSDVSVSVATDTASIKSKIEEFITKFNDVYTYLKTNASTGSNRGVLASDSNSSSLLSMFGSLAYTNIPGISEQELNALYKIGISFNSSTGLSISDSTKFELKIKENGSEVAAIFNSTNGIANSLFNKIDPYLGVNGYLSKAKSGFDNSVSSLNDRKAAVEKRIDKSAGLLKQRYERMQAQLSELLLVQNMFGNIA
jgi:flagellar hook-associated protein 2